MPNVVKSTYNQIKKVCSKNDVGYDSSIILKPHQEYLVDTMMRRQFVTVSMCFESCGETGEGGEFSLAQSINLPNGIAVRAPIGSGKTYVGLEYLKRMVETRNYPAYLNQRNVHCIIVPPNLFDQWLESILRYYPQEFVDTRIEYILNMEDLLRVIPLIDDKAPNLATGLIILTNQAVWLDHLWPHPDFFSKYMTSVVLDEYTQEMACVWANMHNDDLRLRMWMLTAEETKSTKPYIYRPRTVPLSVQLKIEQLCSIETMEEVQRNYAVHEQDYLYRRVRYAEEALNFSRNEFMILSEEEQTLRIAAAIADMRQDKARYETEMTQLDEQKATMGPQELYVAASRMRALDFMIKQIDRRLNYIKDSCPICTGDLSRSLACDQCGVAVCLSCIGHMFETHHINCPMCRNEKYRDAIAKSLVDLMGTMGDQLPLLWDVVAQLCSNLTSANPTHKTLVVYEAAKDLNSVLTEMTRIAPGQVACFPPNATIKEFCETINTFLADTSVRFLLFNIKQLSVGLDLGTVDSLIILNEISDASLEKQVKGRLLRMNRTKDASFFKMIPK